MYTYMLVCIYSYSLCVLVCMYGRSGNRQRGDVEDPGYDDNQPVKHLECDKVEHASV